MGCLSRHPNINLHEFNEFYLIDLLDKLLEENENGFLLGDFDIKLLKIMTKTPKQMNFLIPCLLIYSYPRYFNQ